MNLLLISEYFPRWSENPRVSALRHFDRVWGLRDGRLVLDAPVHTLTLADLDALYPDASPLTDGSRDGS